MSLPNFFVFEKRKSKKKKNYYFSIFVNRHFDHFWMWSPPISCVKRLSGGQNVEIDIDILQYFYFFGICIEVDSFGIGADLKVHFEALSRHIEAK